MAEIIEFKDILRARARRREQALTARCIALMEQCLACSIAAYDGAPPHERAARGVKVRQLEDLIAYASNLL